MAAGRGVGWLVRARERSHMHTAHQTEDRLGQERRQCVARGCVVMHDMWWFAPRTLSTMAVRYVAGTTS